MKITLRPETPADADAIDDLVRTAFAGHPHSDGREPAIVRALRRDGQLGVSLVALDALDGDAIVGHVAFSAVRLGSGDPGWWGLGPVAVQPGRQRQGIGGALIRAGLAQLQAAGAAGCVVLGDPAYYPSFGFRAGTGLRYPGPPPEYFMALAWRGAIPTAEVRYAPAFDAGDAEAGTTAMT